MDLHSRSRPVALAALLAVAVALPACNNLWGWTAGPDSYDALVAEGRRAIRDGQFDRAASKLGAAVEMAPDRGEARYYYAKAVVLRSDVDVIDLVLTITDEAEHGGVQEIFDFETSVADRVYGVNRLVVDALNPIHDGTATTDGLAVADVDLDLAVAYTLRGILRLRDTNGDGRIDENDLPLSSFALSDEDGYSFDGIDEIPPEDLNDMIDDLNDLLASGGDVVDGLDAGGVDPDKLDEIIDSLGGDLSAFYVNTGVPGNPGEGDNDGDGLVDEECRNDLDDDGDGLVDEDSRVFGCG